MQQTQAALAEKTQALEAELRSSQTQRAAALAERKLNQEEVFVLSAQLKKQQQVADALQQQTQHLLTLEEALSEKSNMLQELLAAARMQLAEVTQALAHSESKRELAEAEIALAANRLAEARNQYRASAEQANLYRAQRDEVQQQLEDEQRRNVQMREQNITLVSEADTLAAAHRALQHEFEQLKRQSLRTSITLNEVRGRLKQKDDELAAARLQVVRTRETLSYQLGHALIFGFKSFHNYVRLPSTLWAIHKQAAIRRRQKQERAALAPVRAVAHPPQAVPTAISKPAMAITPSVLKHIKVAAIMDEFTESSYRPECQLLQLSPQHWQQEMARFKPDLLFIESAWFGKDGQWERKVGHKSNELLELVAWCNERKIPTLLWNKEDPVHFETFIHTAKLVDYVFTTDIDCIHRYKEALGHERVYLLPFACQPLIHNPIEKYTRKDAFCFAGAYYTRYPERTRDLGNFIVSLPEFRPVEIFDRNYYKDDPNYKFPEEYRPFIVGNLPFEEIDKAHKGYRYAINLNSIKQSQSMFARRVYELLGSNTITLSNYARGISLMFGELVIASDSGEQLLTRLRERCGDERAAAKLRLAGLRKAMSEHTYQDRLAYIASRIHAGSTVSLLPDAIVLAYVGNESQVQAVLASYDRQRYPQRSLVLVAKGGFTPANVPEDVRVIPAPEARRMHMAELGEAGSWLVPMSADDFYGEHYLLDLMLATRYTDAAVIGKAAQYRWGAGALILHQPDMEYKPCESLPVRSAMTRLDSLDTYIGDFVSTLHNAAFSHGPGLSIDAFNYCRNAVVAGFGPEQRAIIGDLQGLDTGLPLVRMLEKAESIAPMRQQASASSKFSAQELLALIAPPPASSKVSFNLYNGTMQVSATLGSNDHEYHYARLDHAPADLGAADGRIRFHLQQTPGLNIQLVMLFLAADGQRIGHIIGMGNRNHEAEIPEGTAKIRLGLRVLGSGQSHISAVVLGHVALQPSELISQARHLLITNNYPSYDDLYRNGFVHQRVRAYQRQGLEVDVFRLRSDAPVGYHEFEQVECITGSAEALRDLLEHGHYESISVHFLSEAMWEVLQDHVATTPINVWVHGAEIHPWYRRKYNLQTDSDIELAKRASEKRMTFWRGLLKKMPAKLQLVFVSHYFRREVEEDLGFTLPRAQVRIIHNPINTELFAYVPKPPEQRCRILSVRPYASRQYANDLMVQAILLLSREPYFDQLSFTLVGDGVLFEETVAPLRDLPSVKLEQRFLTQGEIAALHKTHGIFLCPTRWDSQGVSRDEAMASGLVPVTNQIAAVPEFTDSKSAMLAPPEDAAGLAAQIADLYRDPARFLAMSKAAARRVRAQSDIGAIIPQELGVMLAGKAKP